MLREVLHHDRRLLLQGQTRQTFSHFEAVGGFGHPPRETPPLGSHHGAGPLPPTTPPPPPAPPCPPPPVLPIDGRGRRAPSLGPRPGRLPPAPPNTGHERLRHKVPITRPSFSALP